MKTLVVLSFLALVAVMNPTVINAEGVTTVTSTKSPTKGSIDGLLAEARKAKGLSNVVPNARLMKAAQKQTADMVAMKKLTHKGRNGSNVRDRIKAQGYKGCVFYENIASTRGDVQAAFDIWMKSKAHKDNIQNPRAKEYGIANSGGYWTLVLSGPC